MKFEIRLSAETLMRIKRQLVEPDWLVKPTNRQVNEELSGVDAIRELFYLPGDIHQNDYDARDKVTVRVIE